MLKKRHSILHSTPKRPRLQKTRWVMGWLVVFLGLVVAGVFLGPVLVGAHPQIAHFMPFFKRHTGWFYVGHAVFIGSTYWWWPAVIRARGKRKGWPEAMIVKACQWKWAVMLMLGVLAVLFLI